MTRSHGIKLIKKYINKKPKDLNLFLNWLGVSQNWLYKEIKNSQFLKISKD